MNTVAIVGFGCAGYHGAKALREADFCGTIDVFSASEFAPANPMLTTYHAAGKLNFEGMFPFGSLQDISRQLELRIFSGQPVTRLCTKDKTLVTTDKIERGYDRILIASGARAFVPPIGEVPQNNIFYLRTPEDAQLLRARMERGDVRHGVVIGASMAGVKVAELLVNAGADCLLADMAPRVFPLAALPEMSEEIHRRMQKKGVQLAFGQGLSGLNELPNGQIEVCFGETRERADVVALCIGVRPQLDFIDPQEIKLDRGIVVDHQMRTSAADIYAAGDCCTAYNLQTGKPQPINLWANAGYQGRTAGFAMAGRDETFAGSFAHNITHFLEMDFIGCGDVNAQGEVMEYRRPDGSFWLKAVLQDGKPACVNLLDNYVISGVIKHYLTKRFMNIGEPISEMQQVSLLQAGMPRAIIERLEGAYANI